MEKTSDLPEADDKGLQDPPSQTWNKPAINALRLLATFISFVIIGANDGLYIILEFPTHTHFSTAIPLIAYLASSALASTTLANRIPTILGHRGIAIFGPLCHVLASAAFTRLPIYPYPGYAASCYALMGLGTGLVEAGWKAWAVQMDMSRVEIETILGIYSTCYTSGFVYSFNFADTIVKKDRAWASPFYFLMGISALGLISCTALFWSESAARFNLNRQSRPIQSNAESEDRTARLYSLRIHGIWFISTSFAVLLTKSHWHLAILWLAWAVKNTALVHPSISDSYKRHPILIGWYMGTMFAKPIAEWLSGTQILDVYLSAEEWVGSRILALLRLN